MTSTQTTNTTQNSAKAASPFAQIQELELREKERTEKEFTALAKEKEEVMQSITKKEDQATEELKTDAKKELKKHSENELSGILMSAQKEATAECEKLEAAYKGREDAAVKELLDTAKNPETLFSTAA